MDFIDEIKQFSKRVDGLKDNLTTEEATKTSLIMPFFALSVSYTHLTLPTTSNV